VIRLTNYRPPPRSCRATKAERDTIHPQSGLDAAQRRNVILALIVIRVMRRGTIVVWPKLTSTLYTYKEDTTGQS